MFLAPVIVNIFQFVALPCCLAGILAPRLCTIVLFADAGNKKCFAMHARDWLHIVSPGLNQMWESEKLYGLFNLKTELNAQK